jgi:excisionase family DNA binding protein
MTTSTLELDAQSPDSSEVQAAERLFQILADSVAHGESPSMILPNDKSGKKEPLPLSAARLLVKVLSEISKGNAVAVMPLKPELTTQESAELLNVSRPFVIKLLERGEIPFHLVGTHRRINLTDVLAYKRESLEERKNVLKELAALNQEIGLYD